MIKYTKAQFNNGPADREKADALASRLAENATNFGIAIAMSENENAPDDLIVEFYVEGSTKKYCDSVVSELRNEFKQKGYKMQKAFSISGVALF